MAVDGGAAMAGHVLDHRHDAFGQEPLGGGAAQRRHRFGPVGISAIADRGTVASRLAKTSLRAEILPAAAISHSQIA